MRIYLALFLSLFTLAISGVSAEQITIGISNQGAENDSITRPDRGMTTQAVLEEFGQPNKKTPSRGQPPISSWHYEHFSVYFESDTVIHSVLKHKPKHLPEASSNE